MKNRSPVAVFLLPFVTFFIYPIVWLVKTKGELNQRGGTIPTAWLLIVPIVSYYWLWKYSEGVDHVTGGKTSAVLSFVLLFLLGSIGQAILQDTYNKLGAGVPAAPAAPIQANTPAAQPQQSQATQNQQTPGQPPTQPAA